MMLLLRNLQPSRPQTITRSTPTSAAQQFRVYLFLLSCLSSNAIHHVKAQLHSFTPEVLEAISQVDVLYTETPFTGYQGTIIHAISGSISAISSSLIIFIIVRSSRRLKFSYHRIMLGMSIMDILESLMMTITSLPMPKDMVYTQFKGFIGNNVTCQAQAAIVNGAGLGTFTYNGALSLYYFCLIVLQMKDDKVSKYVEPFLHICCIGSAISLGTLGILGRFYNPMPFQSWCSVATFPYWCTGSGVGSGVVVGNNGSRTEFDECSLVSDDLTAFQSNVAMYLLLTNLMVWVTILGSMFFVVVAVIRAFRLRRIYVNTVYARRIQGTSSRLRSNEEETRLYQEARKHQDQMKYMLIQSLSYVVASLAVQIFPILNFNLNKSFELYMNNSYSAALMIIFPLQVSHGWIVQFVFMLSL